MGNRHRLLRFSVITIIVFIGSFMLSAEDYVFTFDESDFGLVTRDGVSTIVNHSKNSYYHSDISEPALPYFDKYILIGKDENFKSLSYAVEEKVLATNVTLSTNIAQAPTDCLLDTCRTYSFNTYIRESNYPKSTVEYINTYLMDGYKFLGVSICPFHYDASAKTLKFITRISLSILLENDVMNKINRQEDYAVGKNMREVVEMMIYNKAALAEKYDYNNIPIKGSNDLNILTDVQHDCDFLIIAKESIVHELDSFVNWKRHKGIWTEVLTVEEIQNNNNYAAANLSLSIKKALKDYYNGSRHGLKYVLLAGDSLTIPPIMCYVEANDNVGGTYIASTPSDLFYACFDTMNWDNNGNGVYGEVNDNIDYAPEVFLSRIPIQNSFDALCIFDRIINYEKAPPINNWKDNILLCGNLSDPFSMNGNIYREDEGKGQILLDSIISPYWGNCEWKYFYGGSSTPSQTPSDLQQELSKGYTFVDIMCHGNPDYFDLRDGDYSTSLANNLMNTGCSIITTSACRTNRFTLDVECLSSTLMRSANSGILAYWGSSDLGWYYPNLFKFGASNDYTGAFYFYLLLSPDHLIGTGFNYAKLHFLNRCNTYNYYRWLQLSINPIGDPTMLVYLSQPLTYNNINITSLVSLNIC